jgi:hypothetical protein
MMCDNHDANHKGLALRGQKRVLRVMIEDVVERFTVIGVSEKR